MATHQMQPYLNTRQDSIFRFLGIPSTMRANGDATNDAFGLVEHLTMPPGAGSPYHVHHREDEGFYVLEGRVAFVCDGKWLHAGPGDFVFGPREIPHGFKVEGTIPARMLLLCSPAGFEKFVMELSTDSAAPDMQKLVATAARYHIDILGPLPDDPEAASFVDPDIAAIDSLRSAHRRAMNNHDAAALAAVFTEDAAQMPPSEPANYGAADIRSWSENFFRTFRVDSFDYSAKDFRLAGDHAQESGTYRIRLTARAGNHSFEDSGKYVSIYRKLAGGRWATSHDIWNSDQRP